MLSEADREVETMIRSALAGAFPDDAQLGEEQGLTPGSSGLTWVIDPIDGTAPFLAGLPGWCISIGACDVLGPVIGVIYAPVLDELFVAARGQGARLNGVAIRIAERSDLSTGLLDVQSRSVMVVLTCRHAKEGLWARYSTEAPRPRTPCELRYSDRRLRPRS
jgi:myo-inositol-1(or 4)-monophosphatase